VDTDGDGKITWLELGDYAAYLNDLYFYVWQDIYEGNIDGTENEWFNYLEYHLNR